MKTSLIIESKISKLKKKDEETSKMLHHFNKILENQDMDTSVFIEIRRERRRLISKVADIRVKISHYQGILSELSSHNEVFNINNLKAV